MTKFKITQLNGNDYITIDTASTIQEAEQKVKQLIDAELQEYLDSLDIYSSVINNEDKSFVEYYAIKEDEETQKYMVTFRSNGETITDEMHDTEEVAEKELEKMALEDLQNYKEDFFNSSEYEKVFDKKYREDYEIEIEESEA